MALSMTGFGRAEKEYKNYTLTCEIRTVNNRFCEVSFRLPRKMSMYEDSLRDQIKKAMVRGRIDVSFTFSQFDNNNELPVLNENNVDYIWKTLLSIQKKFNIDSKPSFVDILHFNEIWKPEEIKKEEELEMLDILRILLKEVLESVNSMREMEGENICKDLRKRIENILNNLNEIKTMSKDRTGIEFEKVSERVKMLLDNEQRFDKERVEMEIALLMEKLDISEECVRLDSHCKLFQHELESRNSIGKKLDFILQEMNREANTIASKSNNADISHYVVDIKDQIEKIREQARNIL